MQRFLKVLYFLPAIIGTFLIIVLYAPNIPVSLLFTLVFLWIGSGLLAFNCTIGAICGLISAIVLLFIMDGEYMHIDITPYMVAYIIFYLGCGVIVFKGNKKRKSSN